MTQFRFHGTNYDTEGEAQAAAWAMKNIYDNHPHKWVSIQEVTVNADGSVQVSAGSNEEPIVETDSMGLVTSVTLPSEGLPPSQVDNIDPNSGKFYNVVALISGDNFVKVAAADVAAKILLLRPKFAAWNAANEIVREEQVSMEVDLNTYMPE